MRNYYGTEINCFNFLKERGYSNEEIEKILEFLLDRMSKGASDKRVYKYLLQFRMLKKFLDKSLLEYDKNDLIILLRRIDNSDYSDWTKFDLKQTVKRFFKFLRGEDFVKDIRISDRKVKKKLPQTILTEEEVVRIIENANNIRDKLIISLLYELGLRPHELLNLRIKDVVLNKEFGWVIVHGKTGMRRLLTVSSIPYLKAWLNAHPDPRPDNYLIVTWDNRKMSRNNLIKIVREASRRARIEKRVTPYTFRHSRATFLARILTEQQLKEFFGWTKDSKMPAVYVHLSGRDLDEAILKMYGLKDDSKKVKVYFKAKKCPKCGFVNPPDAKFCMNCGERLF